MLKGSEDVESVVRDAATLAEVPNVAERFVGDAEAVVDMVSETATDVAICHTEVNSGSRLCVLVRTFVAEAQIVHVAACGDGGVAHGTVDEGTGALGGAVDIYGKVYACDEDLGLPCMFATT